MKKSIIAFAITTGFLSLALPSALHAQDQKPTTSTTSDDGGQCSGSCQGGGKKHHKDGDKGEKPKPAPSPAQ